MQLALGSRAQDMLSCMTREESHSSHRSAEVPLHLSTSAASPAMRMIDTTIGSFQWLHISTRECLFRKAVYEWNGTRSYLPVC